MEMKIWPISRLEAVSGYERSHGIFPLPRLSVFNEARESATIIHTTARRISIDAAIREKRGKFCIITERRGPRRIDEYAENN